MRLVAASTFFERSFETFRRAHTVIWAISNRVKTSGGLVPSKSTQNTLIKVVLAVPLSFTESVWVYDVILRVSRSLKLSFCTPKRKVVKTGHFRPPKIHEISQFRSKWPKIRHFWGYFWQFFTTKSLKTVSAAFMGIHSGNYQPSTTLSQWI